MKHSKRVTGFLAVVFGIVIFAAGCTTSSDTKDTNVVERQQAIYQKKQPVPIYNWSVPRDVLIQIYNATVESHDTWTVFLSQGTGTPLWSCPSKGFPIPADTQLTNPSRNTGSQGAVIDQPEPNGLFTSQNTHGTWALCIRGGKAVPVYSEPDVFVFPFAVRVENGQIVDVGKQSSISIDMKNK